MAVRNEHLVVIMLEPVEKGVEFEIWPPHITIVPWYLSAEGQKLDNVLTKIASGHKRFTVSAGKIEQWGKSEKFKVQLVEDNGELHKLHLDVFGKLESNGFPIHQKDFLGEKYTPHFALRNRLQKGHALKTGQEIAINNFSLIKQLRLKGSGRMIKSPVKDYELL